MSVEVSDADTQDIPDLLRDPTVRDAIPSLPMRLIAPLAEPGDAAVSTPAPSWGVKAVGADGDRWTGAGVTVAVLDTGIDKQHEAFSGVDIEEKDFTGEGDGDQKGHGTHCAGTFFGRDVAGARIGIARGIQRALIGKVIGGKGGDTDRLVRAIRWAVTEKGARVVSMSLGIDLHGMIEKLTDKLGDRAQATSHAIDLYRRTLRVFDALGSELQTQGPGCVLVAAAGNSSFLPARRMTAEPPADARGFISVAAVQQGPTPAHPFALWPQSNVDALVAAPGVGIVSAKKGDPKGLEPKNGTSMATPHVAGVAAFWFHALRVQTGRGSVAQVRAEEVIARLTGRAELYGLDPRDVLHGVVQAPR